MKIRRRKKPTTVCLMGLIEVPVEYVNGFQVFPLLNGEFAIRREGDVSACGTFRNRDRALAVAWIEYNGGRMKIKKKKKKRVQYRLPEQISFTYGPGKPITNVEFVPDCGNQFFIFKDTWRGSWHICHFPTDSLLIYDAPSKAYALKVFENVLPLLDLHKIARVLWYGDRRPLSEIVEDYLANVWKVEYSIEEIPSVKQWQKSGFGNSANDVNTFRSKPRLKIKRRK